MKISAIIQARMTSSRLPGKVLMHVRRRPLLSYLVERLRFCNHLDRIIVATTTNIEDDPVESFCKNERIAVFRGQENDVLDRYYQAAKKNTVDHIMRITADCPLIDPDICDHAADIYMTSKADYVATGPTYAEGMDCEILSFAALEDAWRHATLGSEREHLTLYLHNNPDKFRIIILQNRSDDGRYRITVDRKEDFEVVKSVIEHFQDQGSSLFHIAEIKGYLDDHPEIAMLNANVIRNEGLQKSLDADDR